MRIEFYYYRLIIKNNQQNVLLPSATIVTQPNQH